MKNIVIPATIASGRPGAAVDVRVERDSSDITLPPRACQAPIQPYTGAGVFALAAFTRRSAPCSPVTIPIVGTQRPYH
jgi:hypothetical protein